MSNDEKKSCVGCGACGGQCNQIDDTPIEEVFAELDTIAQERAAALYPEPYDISIRREHAKEYTRDISASRVGDMIEYLQECGHHRQVSYDHASM